MFRDVDVVLNDVSGKPLYDNLSLQDVLSASAEMSDEQRETIVEALNKTGRPQITLKRVAVNALQAIFEDERNLDGSEKLKRWQLAMKIHLGGDVDLTTEEIALVKKLIGKLYGASVVGPAWTALEAGDKKTN